MVIAAMPPGAFLLMRHGQTEANARDIICGHTDLPLDDVGRAQAEAAAAVLRGAGIGRIVTSPLLRARQTAEAAGAVLGLVPLPADDLAERDWGAWEGRPRSQLVRSATPPGGESPAAFRGRIRRGLAVLDLGAPTLIVAHSGTAREIHAALATDTPHQRMVNGQIVLWQPGPRGWRCHECFKPRC